MVPSLDGFLYAFVRKEAVLSSQIEGTQATLVDLLSFEAQEGGDQSPPPNADVEEVCNYLDALTFARAQLANPKGLPLSIADEAVTSARQLFVLVAADRTRLLAQGSMSIVALRLFELLPRHPVVTVASVMKLVETTKPTAGRAIDLLAAAGVLVETTGKKRDRSFVYQAYLDRLRVGTELERVQRKR
jgi:Fic family protein